MKLEEYLNTVLDHDQALMSKQIGPTSRKMLQPIIHQLKILLIFLIDIMFRLKKVYKSIWYGKHEMERIIEAGLEIYERTHKIDEWLKRTRCKPIRTFLDKNFTTSLRTKDSTAQKVINRVFFDQRLQIYPNSSNSNSDRKCSLVARNSKFKIPDDGDEILSLASKELTNDLCKVIDKNKRSYLWTSEMRERLRDSLHRILSYKLIQTIAEQLAATKYDVDNNLHFEKLINLWNNLVHADQEATPIYASSKPEKVFPPELSYEISDKSEIVSNRWSHIGFQGEDPGTDFRGMGMLGLFQLEYLSRKPQQLARDLLSRSLNEKHSYPFAIVGINVTYSLLNLFKDGSMKHLFYDNRDTVFRDNLKSLKLFKTLCELYVELFLRFDCFWHESKPETIFEFKGLMEKFVSIIQFDLCNRNFSLKFIYS